MNINVTWPDCSWFLSLQNLVFPLIANLNSSTFCTQCLLTFPVLSLPSLCPLSNKTNMSQDPLFATCSLVFYLCTHYIKPMSLLYPLFIPLSNTICHCNQICMFSLKIALLNWWSVIHDTVCSVFYLWNAACALLWLRNESLFHCTNVWGAFCWFKSKHYVSIHIITRKWGVESGVVIFTYRKQNVAQGSTSCTWKNVFFCGIFAGSRANRILPLEDLLF